jgi:hypothetical protein
MGREEERRKRTDLPPACHRLRRGSENTGFRQIYTLQQTYKLLAGEKAWEWGEAGVGGSGRGDTTERREDILHLGNNPSALLDPEQMGYFISNPPTLTSKKISLKS